MEFKIVVYTIIIAQKSPLEVYIILIAWLDTATGAANNIIITNISGPLKPINVNTNSATRGTTRLFERTIVFKAFTSLVSLLNLIDPPTHIKPRGVATEERSPAALITGSYILISIKLKTIPKIAATNIGFLNMVLTILM